MHKFKTSVNPANLPQTNKRQDPKLTRGKPRWSHFRHVSRPIIPVPKKPKIQNPPIKIVHNPDVNAIRPPDLRRLPQAVLKIIRVQQGQKHHPSDCVRA
jgi:hypothetical protein